jgi:hypothetical protein
VIRTGSATKTPSRVSYRRPLPNVTLRVVPIRKAASGQQIRTFCDHGIPHNDACRVSEPDIVYTEDFTGGRYLDKPSEVEQYHPCHLPAPRKIT